MIVHGREVGFLLTVGASKQIAEMCKDGDLANIAGILDGSYTQRVDKVARFIEAMSAGHETAKAFTEKDYSPKPLTVDELMTLDPVTFADLESEAVRKFAADQRPTVEAEPVKKKENG